MALVHRNVRLGDWPVLAWPEHWRRVIDLEDGHEWLRVEEFEDGDTLVVRAELPDIDPDKDVEVTVDDGMVRIHGRRDQKSEHKDSQGFRSEFRYGEFDRAVALPGGASPDDVKATYSDGILEVRVPCRVVPEPKPAKIAVARS